MIFANLNSRYITMTPLSCWLYYVKGEGTKVVYSCYWNSISQLRSVTCHMGWSHSVTCHPTQVNTPRQRSVLNLPTPEGWKA